MYVSDRLRKMITELGSFITIEERVRNRIAKVRRVFIALFTPYPFLSLYNPKTLFCIYQVYIHYILYLDNNDDDGNHLIYAYFSINRYMYIYIFN